MCQFDCEKLALTMPLHHPPTVCIKPLYSSLFPSQISFMYILEENDAKHGEKGDKKISVTQQA